ncbi:Futalosine hydrolase [compost metagenome]
MNADLSAKSRILIMTAVEAEREAVLRGLQGAVSFDVCLAGVGPVSAAASTASLLAKTRYDLVISAGIGGGFQERAKIGSIVIASSIIAADLGAEAPDHPESFSSVDELGFGSSIVPVQHELSSCLVERISGMEVSVCYGPVVTLSTVTGTAETASKLARRFPGVAAEAMEGYGVALAAHQLDIPVVEIRAISNYVGPRQRELWKIGDALKSLELACSKLPELFLEVTSS